MKPIPVDDHSGVGREIFAGIVSRVSEHRTLKHVLDWCLAQKPPILDTDVVTQDEFTHDLIVPLSEEVYLVYDSN